MDRLKIKKEMYRKRGKKCQLCNDRNATDMHEIINRGRVQGNKEAKELIFQEEICSLLCRECHSEAHNPKAREQLFIINARIYGHDAVVAAIESVRSVMRTGLDIEFPEEEWTQIFSSH